MANMGIVAFAFGVPANCRANRRLAECAVAESSCYKAPIFTQEDINISCGPHGVTTLVNTKEVPPSTLRMARIAVIWAENRYMDTLCIVAAVPHAWRARRDLEEALREKGLSIKIQVSCLPKQRYKYWQWFSGDSTQPYTKSLGAWLLRDLSLRCMPLWLYKRIVH